MEQKNKEEGEELCCADQSACSIDCAPKKDEENSESKCGCGGCC